MVGMKPLSERDENHSVPLKTQLKTPHVGMKPLSERDENPWISFNILHLSMVVGMKPLSERDENFAEHSVPLKTQLKSRNEATL